jgi:hypothetical protein
LIPLVEVVGNADKVAPEQIAATDANVGVTVEVTVMVTSEEQDKSEAVHLKTFAPIERPLTVVFGFVLDTNVPEPETTDQEPVAGETAARVADVVAHND